MKRVLLAIFGLCLNSTAMAATVWAPTNLNGDVNIVLATYSSGVGTLALFDDSDLSFSSQGLMLGISDTVTFAATELGYTATNNAGDQITLSDTYNFVFGMLMNDGTTWLADTSAYELPGSGFYQLNFGGVGDLIVADVQAVPLPAAVWLFGSALLSLVGFSRRRKLSLNRCTA